MGSSGKIWKRTSVHAVVLEWLRGERHRIEAAFPDDRARAAILDCIDRADLASALQNRMRLRMLNILRLELIVEIPPDTSWYVVSGFGHDYIMGLHVICGAEWADGSGDYRIGAVAARRQITLRGGPPFPAMPILFGTTKDGPFTIIEGNHRLVAYAGSGQTDFFGPVMIGISPTDCVWNGEPQASRMLLMRDIIAHRSRMARADGQDAGEGERPGQFP